MAAIPTGDGEESKSNVGRQQIVEELHGTDSMGWPDSLVFNTHSYDSDGTIV